MPGGWRNRFRSYGCRWTVPRQVILDILTHTSEHLSAEDIWLTVHKIHPSVGLATVYRTLNLLVQMGVVFKFDFGDGRSRYELRGKSGSHHHLVCTRCGRIIDYKDSIEEDSKLMNEIEKRLSEKYNFKVASRQIRFYGLCEECQKATKEKEGL